MTAPNPAARSPGGPAEPAPSNPMVDYLNSLRTQQQEANATYVHEARQEFLSSLRSRAPWFPDEAMLHAPTKLDRLSSDLAEGRLRARLIFLTGDAGDGKTAFCAGLARTLGHSKELELETVIGPWHILKDASEVDEDVLRAAVVDHLNPSVATTLVVAINEGRLRRLFRDMPVQGQRLWDAVIAPALESWLSPEGAALAEAEMSAHQVLVLNFRQRFHVRAVAPALLNRWTQPQLWESSPACGACPARQRCPILANAKDLRSPDLQARVSDVLAWCHFSGHRLPFRRLQAVLALATTGGLRCADLLTGPLRAEPAARLLRYRFYNALFLREPQRDPVDVRPEPIARAFAAADPERFVDLDREHLIDDLIRTPAADAATAVLTGLEADAAASMMSELAPSEVPEATARLTADLAQLVRSLRRYLALKDEPPAGSSWRRTLRLLEDAAASPAPAHDLRRHVVEGLNRLHRIEEIKREKITSHQIDPAGFRTAARQVLELSLGTEFDTSVVRGPTLPSTVGKYLESTPSEIFLEATAPGGTGEPARLRLDARLVDILLRVLDGYDSWQALGSHRRDLARFHARLMALAASAKHEPQMTLRIGSKRYGVSVDGGRLRFEGQR